MDSCCSSNKRPVNGFFQNKLILAATGVVFLLALSLVVPVLVSFRGAFIGYARLMFLPLAAGLLAGGVIDHYIPREYISSVLAGGRKRHILLAVAWGFLMTLCSHGIIALTIQLYKKGAAPSSVIAFLMASPWANFPLTLMLAGFFGPVKAAFVIFSAIGSALITGLIFQVLERKGMIEVNPHMAGMTSGFDIPGDIRRRWNSRMHSPDRLAAFGEDLAGILRGTRDLAGMVVWWMIIGAGLASVISAYVPSSFFHQFMGKSVAGMLGTLAAATAVETCSTCTSPVAFEIYRQTGAFGNALIFLLAGAATNYSAIGLLWVNAGRRTALGLPLIAVPLVLFFGYLGNWLF